MNTRFSYLYRDASNYKKYSEVIFSGSLKFEQLLPFLKDKTFFIPSEIGLDDLQGNEWSFDDHVWHEIENIQPTPNTPTVNIKAMQVLERFKVAYKDGWNEYAVMKRKGLL
ncbi:MAG: hypothetical protein SRB1_00824 [Desulfobacteraceae bacterium Eth-SRB1]|nr:MAG: hypothetical protein SRB1_00824 [Desulfobacteraceae bacterium Eth-SRB1]